MRQFLLVCIWVLPFFSSLFAVDFEVGRNTTPKSVLDSIKRGFDVNAVRKIDGYTPMHYAAETGSVELASELILRGSTLNPITFTRQTPLALAIQFEKKDLIRIFLEEGVDPNFKLGELFDGRSHFHYYITKTRKLDKYIFDLFLKKGANLETKDRFEETPLITIAQSSTDKKEHLQFLLSAKANIRAQAKGGKTALMGAVFTQNPEFIKILLSAGAPIDQKDSQGNTALIAMVNMGTSENGEILKPNIMRLLIDSGAKVDETNLLGNTALHEAVVGSKIELLELLGSSNAYTGLANKKSLTSLDQAIINENYKVVESLLKYEKDLNALDQYGSTKLHNAVINEKYVLIKLLLQAGADKNAPDKWGKTPINVAETMKLTKALELLESGP